MDVPPQSRFSKDIKELFSSGTVILFVCAATEDFPILSVSENVEEMLGFGPSYFLEHKNGWSNQIHPEDRDRVRRRFHKIVAEGEVAINEYRFRTKDGSEVWLRDEIKLIKDPETNKQFIYGSSIDITERKKAEITLKENKTEELKEEIERRTKAEDRLQKRLSYEKAISKCSSLLLESTSPKMLEKSLDVLREVTNSDRVYLYKNEKKDGDLYLEPVSEVTGEGIELGFSEREKRIKYSEIPWWRKKLSEGEIIHAKVEELPDPEQSILKDQQVKSVLVIPISVGHEWYGYVGFADTQEERTWHEDEISLLKTAAGILGTFEKRKNIERTLVQQRNYTNTILNRLPSIYILMDEGFRFVRWNKNAERYSEYCSEELSTMQAFDLIAEEDHQKLVEATNRVKKKEGEGAELYLQTKTGDKIPYYWRGYYIELEKQKYFLCVGVDITQQKRTEKELINEKRFNEALIESLPGNFYMLDGKGDFHRWNENFVQSMGYSPPEIADLSPADLFKDEEFEKIESGIEKVFVEGEAELETIAVTKDGKEIPYYLTGKRFERDGENYLVGVGHDISEQIKAREKLRRSEELFRNLFLNSPAGIVMVGPDNKVQSINKSFENLFGYSQEEIEGRDIDEVIVPDDDHGKRIRKPVNLTKDSFHREAQRLTKEGDEIDVFIASIPVFVDKKPLAGFGMYIDITEQKKYEKEIYSSLKEKHVLLQEIHHRVKNNLAVVSGLLQLQMYETEDPVIQETLRESENRIQTMALIHEKLYNSQNLSRISCDSYIGDLVETIRNTIETRKEISVKTDIAAVKLNINKAVPFALLVNEVVTNSFKHAFKNKDQGTISINLSKEGDHIYAQISDNGIGLQNDLSPQEQDSLGMNLINNFAEQLAADWEMGSDDGTYIHLKFDAGDVTGSSSTLTEL